MRGLPNIPKLTLCLLNPTLDQVMLSPDEAWIGYLTLGSILKPDRWSFVRGRKAFRLMPPEKLTVSPPGCPPFCTASCHLFNERAFGRGTESGSCHPYSGLFRHHRHRSSTATKIGTPSARDVHAFSFSRKRFALFARERRLLQISCEGGWSFSGKPIRWIAMACRSTHDREAVQSES